MAPTTTSGAVYDEMKDFEKRCNERESSLNAYLVLYEAKNEKKETVVRKTVMVSPTATHVVVRFPTAVKIELLSDAVVSIAPVIAPVIGEETDEEQVMVPQEAEMVEAPIQTPPIAPQTLQAPPREQRNIPLLPGLRLCRVCAFSPFNGAHVCTSNPKGHRFETSKATERCPQFQFP